MGKNKSYTPAPEIPDEIAQRLMAVMEVLAGVKTVSEAARGLNLSRNHFQTILHRGVNALLAEITPKTAGRPAKPEALATLEAEVEKLRRENAQLQSRVGSTDRLLEVASGLLHGRIRMRAPRRAKDKAGDEGDGTDPEPELRRTLAEIDEMRQLGLSTPLACAVAGVHPATVRRWRGRQRLKLPMIVRREHSFAVPIEAVTQVQDLVRRLKGQPGAESLSHSVVGISRRQASRIKSETLIAMERERKAALTRMTVTTPGVMRGMDGVHFHGAQGPRWALIAADSAVPYRTSVAAGAHYDTDLVTKALRRDIEQNGAPIVYRLDRAKAHDAPAARAVLEAHQIIVLHGPPRYPRFYGQLERQNKEHRAWDDELRQLGDDEIEQRLLEMLAAVNGLWRRRTLGWQTASEVWAARPHITVDRKAILDEVKERAARLASLLERRGKPADLAERLAIEQTLETKGLLRKEVGGWC